jgi:hypothetical protein
MKVCPYFPELCIIAAVWELYPSVYQNILRMGVSVELKASFQYADEWE